MTFVNGEIPQASKFNDLVASEDLNAAILNYINQFNGYATTAAASADIASQNAQIAQNAAVQSIIGQANAAISANIYPTVAAAQSAINAGSIPVDAIFNVVSANSNNYLDQYKNIAGTATFNGVSTPSSQYVASVLAMVPQTLSDNYLFTITDAQNRIGAGLKDDGTFVAPKMSASTSNIVDTSGGTTLSVYSSSNGINVVDGNGKIAARLNNDGSVNLSSLSVQNLIAPNLNVSSASITAPVGYNTNNIGALADFSTLGGMGTAYGNKRTTAAGLSTRRLGTIISPDSTKSFMSSQVESPCVWFDDADLLYHMVFTGYSSTTPTVGSICHATSLDLVNWNVDSSALLQGSGVSGSPDNSGCTGPYMMKSPNGTYYLFYIGLPVSGYEGGTLRICLATASSVNGPWTRLGVMVDINTSVNWRNTCVYHVSITSRNGTYYMFFNAKGSSPTGGSDSSGNERIGLATSTSLTGPWVVDDVNSPLITTLNGSWKSQKVGDPSVWRDGNLWYMSYFGYNGTNAYDSMAVTTDSNFPYGWVEYGAPTLSPLSTARDEYSFTHKPFIYHIGGRQLHFYTGVGDRRVICLAVSGAAIDEIYAPGSSNVVRTIVGPSRSPGAAEDRFSPELTTLPVTRVGIDYTGAYSIYRENSNGFTQNMGFNFDGNSVAIGGTTALATTATNGFMYIPVISGTPTGTPDSKSGRVAICFDSTNNKLWAYNGSWKSSTLS